MAVKPIPDKFHTLTPYLVVQGVPRLIDFLEAAFGAREIHRTTAQSGHVMHAQVEIGDSMLMMGEAMEGLSADAYFDLRLCARHGRGLSEGHRGGRAVDRSWSRRISSTAIATPASAIHPETSGGLPLTSRTWSRRKSPGGRKLGSQGSQRVTLRSIDVTRLGGHRDPDRGRWMKRNL